MHVDATGVAARDAIGRVYVDGAPMQYVRAAPFFDERTQAQPLELRQPAQESGTAVPFPRSRGPWPAGP